MRNSNNCKTLTGIHFALGIYIHDVIRDVEGKKERKTPEAMEKWKMRVASFEPTTLCTPDKCSTNRATKAGQLEGSESNISYMYLYM